MILTKKTPRLDITINEETKSIIVQQRWKYELKCDPGTLPWTKKEKIQFHTEADRLIWKTWGSTFTLNVKGTSDFAKKLSKQKFQLRFDLKRVEVNEHWKVQLKKIVPGFLIQSEILWEARILKLDTEDIKIRETIPNKYQFPVVHEFGHTIGNIPQFKHGDEYQLRSKFSADKNSIMHSGSALRHRHVDYILSQLNSMIPNTEFYI